MRRESVILLSVINMRRLKMTTRVTPTLKCHDSEWNTSWQTRCHSVTRGMNCQSVSHIPLEEQGSMKKTCRLSFGEKTWMTCLGRRIDTVGANESRNPLTGWTGRRGRNSVLGCPTKKMLLIHDDALLVFASKDASSFLCSLFFSLFLSPSYESCNRLTGNERREEEHSFRAGLPQREARWEKMRIRISLLPKKMNSPLREEASWASLSFTRQDCIARERLFSLSLSVFPFLLTDRSRFCLEKDWLQRPV